MPTLTLTVSNEVAERIRLAYGVNSLTEVKQSLVDQIKQQVNSYESSLISLAEDIKIQQAVDLRKQALENNVSDIQSTLIVE